jgi:hypothetical protein
MLDAITKAVQTNNFLPLMLLMTATVIIASLAKRFFTGRGRYRYQANTYLMTRAENNFFTALQGAFNDRYFIFSKVRIADVMTPDYRNGSKLWWRAFVKISSKHIDFVLVVKRTRRIVACVELDDASHRQAGRIKRDRFVNAAFEAAQLPLIRIPTAKTYNIDHLRSLLS